MCPTKWRPLTCPPTPWETRLSRPKASLPLARGGLSVRQRGHPHLKASKPRLWSCPAEAETSLGRRPPVAEASSGTSSRVFPWWLLPLALGPFFAKGMTSEKVLPCWALPGGQGQQLPLGAGRGEVTAAADASTCIIWPLSPLSPAPPAPPNPGNELSKSPSSRKGHLAGHSSR